MNDFSELQRLFNILFRRWWLLLLLTGMAVGLAYSVSKRQTPVYEAKVTVLVGEITQVANLNREDVQMSELFAQTYADLAVRQPVLQGVVEMLNLNTTWERLKEQVYVSSIDGTQLIEIRVEANLPDLARSIADEVAKHLILLGPENLSDREGDFVESFVHQQMEETQTRILSGQQRIKEIEISMSETKATARLVELQTEKTNLEQYVADLVLNYVQLSSMTGQNKNPNSLSIIEPAYAKNVPIRPRVDLTMLLGGGLGMLLAIGIIFLWEFLDDTVKSVNDLSSFENLNLLGTIGRIKGRKYSDKIITHLNPLSPTREAYRMIRNKIRFGPGDQQVRTIVVTSAEPEEGKSVTTANLAIIMAQANIRTVLIDADLRRPVLHLVFNEPNNRGLANLLEKEKMDIEYCLKDTEIKNLQIITSGETSQDQSDRLLSERISEILEFLKEQVELIIIDSPPALLAADASILANRADGVVIVVRAGKSKRRPIRQTIIDLKEANANILGYIFNQTNKEVDIAAYAYRKRPQEKNLFKRIRFRNPERTRSVKRDQPTK
jgi:non-specific protein-tyrosine kinase